MANEQIQIVHAHSLPLPRSPRGHEMALAFGLCFDPPERQAAAQRSPALLPDPGQILFLSGASGSGKSSLLRLLARRARKRYHVINLRALRLADRCVLDLFDSPDLAAILRRLSAVGLAEAWTWLRRPRELSEGQRWRLKLALAFERAARSEQPVLLVCDEFCAVLDRVSAQIIAACVRRAVDANNTRLAALLATSHDDLDSPLQPDLHLECDFGQHILTRHTRSRPLKRGAR